MRALTGLNRAGQAVQAAQQQVKGKPDEMPLSKIMKDPDNPRPPLHLRTPEEQQKQGELNANIKKRGVKSPISLRPHPEIPDMWIINHGHCRFDGAEEAGQPTIPYFIDPNFDSYDQVAENLHRADLSPWSIAEFIQRKLKEKQTKGQIAEGLGKENESYITEHLALVDAPQCLHQAYQNGVRSTRTLYDLRRAYEEFPEQVESWCESGAKITRNTIQEQLQLLRKKQDHVEADLSIASPLGSATSEFRHDEKGAKAEKEASHPLQVATTEPEFRHDEKNSQASPSPAAANSSVKNDSLVSPVTEESTAKFRHDEKQLVEPKEQRAPVATPRVTLPEDAILVQYMGKTATIAPNTTVTIIVDGQDIPLEVPLSQLVFKSPK